MGRAILFFLLVLGIVIGGLMLLRRTANMPPPERDRSHPRVEIKPKDDDDEDRSGW
jgi:hypothetical protein